MISLRSGSQPDARPDVFAYSDFRLFLSAWFEARARRERRFNQAYVCRKLGLPNSRSYFNDVLRGRRILSPQKTEDLLALMGLSEDEAKYFRILVRFNQSMVPAEKEYHLDQLIALNRSPVARLDRKAYDYYREWHHSAVRALLDVMDVKDDPTPLARAIFPPVSLPKVRESLALLGDLGLVRRNADGCWKPADQLLHSGASAQDEIIRRYQAACLEVARTAVLNPGRLPQNVSTETMSLSEAAYRRIEQRLQKFKSEVRSIVHKDEARADRVYQLNIQLLPHTR